MNYRDMSDHDLQEAWRGVTDELNRRTTLAAAPGELDAILTRVLEAQGLQPGDPWRAPASTIDAYPEGWTVTHDRRTWTSRTTGNTSKPGRGEGWADLTAP